MPKKLAINMSNLLALDSPISLEDIDSLEASTYCSLSSFHNTKVAVTGANGFLASNIIYYLLILSKKLSLNLQINALCRSRSRLSSRFSFNKYFSNSSCDSSLLFSKYNPYDFDDIAPAQVVIHAASNASPSSYSSDPTSTCLINTLGTIRAIEYARKSNASCFVYFSTSGVYGFNHPHISSYKENQFGFIDCASSDNIYIESKRIGECITSTLCNEYDIPFSILRPSINYGPGLDLSDERSISSFINSAFTNQPISLTSDGSASRSYLYIKDFMELFLRVISSPCNGVVNIASSHSTRIIDLARLVHLVSNITSDVVYLKPDESQRIRRVEFSKTSTCQDKAQSIYSWTEKTTLQEGLNRTLSHYHYLASNI